MPPDEPGWWYGSDPPPRLLAPFLAPLAQLYGAIAKSRFRRGKPYHSSLPVICAGNFTAGGTGKTPLALFIAHLLLQRGEMPCFLTRGYGGSETGPTWVEGESGAAARFGDEPLLLAQVAPTLIARDRAAGARHIEASGRGLSAIVMDDGLQNASLAKDLCIAVVDAGRGLGNGLVIPAGPLRAPIDFQLGLVDAIIVREAEATAAGEDGIGAVMRRRFPGPVLTARIEPRGEVAWLTQAPLVAFAGIANPQRFFALIERLKGRIVARRTFRDHHAFSSADVAELSALADANGALLVTTEKDWVRLAAGEGFARALSARARALPIALTVDERDRKRLASLVEAAIDAARRRDAAPPPA